ncbi:phage holin [Exiguobacterium acetylicum]|uniref:phage holin n=1 Tax=Exiguobacterium acetylicum TaxID=41170 RepID=UPI001EE1626B|nr:phage holin [Exiguobacterium acetylicum]UKS57483.1 SPP1 phage holin family protein [Exiguobacterium acetylicum]
MAASVSGVAMIRVQAWIRLLIPLYVFLELLLPTLGFTALPVSSSDVERFVTGLIGLVGLLIAWWKNNDVTERALRQRQAQEQMENTSITD